MSLSSGILSTRPNHLNLWALMKWIILSCSIKWSRSSLVLILYKVRGSKDFLFKPH
jgi:hypothetical protein